MFRGFLGTIVTGGSEVRRCPPGEDVEENGQAPIAEYTADSTVSQGHSSTGSLCYELDLVRLKQHILQLISTLLLVLQLS